MLLLFVGIDVDLDLGALTELGIRLVADIFFPLLSLVPVEDNDACDPERLSV